MALILWDKWTLDKISSPDGLIYFNVFDKILIPYAQTGFLA